MMQLRVSAAGRTSHRDPRSLVAEYQLGAYPRGARGELALREATLYLAENIYSLTEHSRPWLKALELFGGGAEGPVTVRTWFRGP